ncbi:MAG: hypothetical protein HA490_05945 [Archaeoglobales archaeon]|nr:hypothetical protein [Archaeoglobales archaeon]
MIIRLSLRGLKCKACISAVKSVFEENGAVVRGISLKEAEIELSEDKIEKIIQEIKELGYGVGIVEVQR